jgi:CubicO group peptidase (beta-lactamase class C family)
MWVGGGRVRIAAALVALTCAIAAGSAGTASAAKRCDEPGARWQRATPAEAGMDAAKLQSAVDYGTTQLSFAIRVYRHGCLVMTDRLGALNARAQYESWSAAKSITSMVFGRAMTLGLIGPDDPVGALVPEADAAHGAITMRDLLTMTSGLRWNGFRDYDIAMPDRLRDALTVDVVHKPGTFFEYSQSGPALLAEAVQRAVGEDFQAFAQRELFAPIGIPAGSWRWTRDSKGHTQGFFGMNMVPDDYARLGDLLRRGGIWHGKRLLSQRYMREAVAPSQTNGCYGWLIWVNAAKPCIGPTISTRPVRPRSEFPGLPADLYDFSGLFGQLVTVMPTQDIEVARFGQDPGLINFSSADGGWEAELYRRILASLTDEPMKAAADPTSVSRAGEKPNADYGFQTSLFEPDQVFHPWTDPSLPPAGPARARAVRLRLATPHASRTGVVSVRLTCPARAASPCTGEATLTGASAPAAYAAAPGETKLLRFTLTRTSRRPLEATIGARNDDAAGGTSTAVAVRVLPAPRRPHA